MTKFIYSFLLIEIAAFIFKIFSYFNSKAAKRENNWKKILSKIYPKGKKLRILVHASSMGEFEQAKPVIEQIIKICPNCEVIASFFSPSGYKNQKKYKLLDFAVYMPVDTRKNAKRFAEAINPDISIFVRYDLWLNVLDELKLAGSKNYLICATKPSNKFLTSFKLTKKYFEMCFDNFEKIFTVGEQHTLEINKLCNSADVITLTDTRADRILNMVIEAKSNKIINHGFLESCVTLVAGSSWKKDEEIISEAVNEINSNQFICRVIYTPHEPTEKNIERIQSLHQKVLKLSVLLNEIKIFNSSQISESLNGAHIVVDSIGKLLKLYANADIAYIGNGFGKSVHSVSEPAGYGIPIACGPNIHNMPDAVTLNRYGGLKIIYSKSDLKEWLEKMILDESLRKSKGKIAEDYILSALGASAKIAETIIENSKELNIEDS